MRHDSKKPTRDEASALRVRVTGFLMMDPVHPDRIEHIQAYDRHDGWLPGMRPVGRR